MESPQHLIEQVAKEKGVSPSSARRALYLKALAEDGRSLHQASDALGIAHDGVRTLCRKFMIDLSDYRPYAAKERRGEVRPQPAFRDIHLPVSGLPLFHA